MSRNALTVALGLFIVGWGTNVGTPYLVIYRDRLGLGANQTQLIFVIYVAGILSTLLISGQLSDRFGRRNVLIPSLLLSAVASALMILGRDSYAWLLFARVLLGVVSGASIGVGAAWLQELMGPAQQTRAAIVTTIATYGGFGIGPLVSMLWDYTLPWPLVLPFLLHVALAIGIVGPLRGVAETAPATSRSDRWRPRLQFGVPVEAVREFRWLIVPVAVWVFAFPSTGFALFPVLITDAVDARAVLIPGVAGALTAWSGAATRPIVNRLGATRSLPIGVAMGACGYMFGTAAFLTNAWLLVGPAAILLGGASGVVSTACLAKIGDMTSPETRGALTATFYLLAYSGMAMPLVITGLASVIGTTTALLVITAAAAIVAASTPTRRRLAGISNR